MTSASASPPPSVASDHPGDAPAPPPWWGRLLLIGALPAGVALSYVLMSLGHGPMALPPLITVLALGYTRPGWDTLRTRGFWVRALVAALLAVLVCWVAVADRFLMAVPFVILLVALCVRWREESAPS